jgi:hypothetical protein
VAFGVVCSASDNRGLLPTRLSFLENRQGGREAALSAVDVKRLPYAASRPCQVRPLASVTKTANCVLTCEAAALALAKTVDCVAPRELITSVGEGRWRIGPAAPVVQEPNPTEPQRTFGSQTIAVCAIDALMGSAFGMGAPQLHHKSEGISAKSLICGRSSMIEWQLPKLHTIMRIHLQRQCVA